MEQRRAWGVVVAGFFALAISGGVGFYALAVLIEAILTELEWNLTQLSIGILLWGLAGAVCSPFAGRLIDRHGSRPVMCVGVAITFVATLGLSQTNSLGMFYAFMMLGAIGSLCNTYIPVAAAIAHWFDEHRGAATGVAMLGLGLGGLAVPLAASALLEPYGWRTTLMIFAGISLLAYVPILWGIREPHHRIDGGGEEEAPEAAVHPEADLDLREALRTRSFWGVSLGDAVAGAMFAIFNIHLVLYLSADLGDEVAAVRIYGTLNVCLALGTILFGAMADRVSLRVLMVTCYALPAVGLALLLGPAGIALGFGFAIIAGLAGGGRQALFPVALMHSFGPTHTAAIYGVSNSFFLIGNALGPVLAAILYDATGQTRLVYGFVTIALAVSAVLVSLLRKEARTVT